MSSRKLEKPLVKDDTYVVMEEHPAYKYGKGEDKFRRSRSAIRVYAPSVSDDDIFLCRTCEQFVATTVQGVHSHMRVHGTSEPAVNEATMLRVIAFNLLPEKLQTQLLAKARRIVGAS